MAETNVVVNTTEEKEEQAPALPTTEPPALEAKTEAAEQPKTEAEEAAATEEKPQEATEGGEVEKPKAGARLRKRLTIRWGKNRDQPDAPKVEEPPADPRQDVMAWIGSMIPAAVHKVNHSVLEWVQQSAIEDESARQPIPGKDGQTTRNQFLAFLRDGDLLVKLANKLQPEAITPEVAEEGADATKQKEVRTKNVESFAQWANQTLGVEEGKGLTADDLLNKGKNGYSAVFDTLWNLGMKAHEKFAQNGIDVDAIVAAASAVVRTNLVGQIMAFFRRNRRAPVEEKPEEKTAEEEAKPAEEEVKEQVEEAVCEKVDATAAPTVAAH